MESTKHYHCANSPKFEEGNISTLSTETSETLRGYNPFEVSSDPTAFLTMIHEQIVQKDYYLTHKNILVGTEITRNMRAKMRNFLMLECERQKYMRETCVLACRYIDLYFLHGGKVNPEDFQTMAISCLILASKLNESRYPAVSPKSFTAEELSTWELSIVHHLKYRLHPCTHVLFAQRIIILWNQFINLQRPQLIQSITTKGIDIVMFYEILDLVFMVLESLTFDMEQLAVNLFYLLFRKVYQMGFQLLLLLPEREITLKLYIKDELRLIFQRFLLFYSSKELRMFLWDFIAINHIQSERKVNRDQYPQTIRQFAYIQTHSNNAYEIIKKLVNYKTRSKKLSCTMIMKTLKGHK